MKKQFIFLGMAAAMMASCTSDDFVGTTTESESQKEMQAIQFSGEAPSLTRAAGTVDDAEKLGFKFNVLGTKSKTGSTVAVFAQAVYDATNGMDDGELYTVWYTEGNAGSTTTNPNTWEYVAAAGAISIGKTGSTTTFNLGTDQTIKYWDYSYDQYDFVAYANTNGATISAVKNNEFTVSGTAAELAGLYIADKRVIAKSDINYKNEVQFTFRAGSAKVRIGFYETIPGYSVRNMTFRSAGSNFTETATAVTLDGTSFLSVGKSTDEISYKVSFADTDGAVASITPSATGTKNYYQFGTTFLAANTDMGTTAAGTTNGPSFTNNSTEYIDVLPNQGGNGVMTLYVDYELYNDKTQEVIKVTGAKAAIPAEYTKWKPNYAYTYLFKITDNTNGTTGAAGTDPAGLFPITFDAVTAATTTGANQGTVTTVSTPTITTYQAGSTSSSGITYAMGAGTDSIYVTVSNDGATLADLSASNIELYEVTAGKTEADLINAAPAAANKKDVVNFPTYDATAGSAILAKGKYAAILTTGLNAASKTYAIKYTYGTPSQTAYKVIVFQ